MPAPNKEHVRAKSSPITRDKDSRRKSFRKRSAEAPEWDNVSPALVHAIVCACATSNSPATLSYTRDGSALCVAVYHNGERYLDYLSGSDEVGEYLDWLLDELLDLPSSQVANLRQAKLG